MSESDALGLLLAISAMGFGVKRWWWDGDEDGAVWFYVFGLVPIIAWYCF